MVSGSNPQRIEPLRKHTQFRAIAGLRSSDGLLHAGRNGSLLPSMSGRWSAVEASLPKQEWRRRGIGHVCGCPTYRQRVKSCGATGEPETPCSPRGIGCEGAKEGLRGGTAVVLGAQESCVHGEGR